ncbi:MAG: hypothetical protein JRG70_08670 [Deltaproteobacteria bacterium]|nr:hypothetical protein [Deltaproteobacteria bacterium]
MRHLLHFGIFVLALAAVTQADAQDRRRGDRHATVVIAAGGGPRMVRPVYDSRRSMDRPSRAVYDAQRAYFDQRQDLEQIVRIAERWEHAVASRDRHAQWKIDRRLDAWLEREIRESIREPHHHRYTQRMRLLSDELARLERKKKHGHGYDGRGYDGRGYERRGYEGRGHRGYYRNKARILDELVMLSERQVQHARANVRYPFRLSFAHR